MAIWFTSDTHYHHKNICRGVSAWDEVDETRDFTCLEDMDNRIVENINSSVLANDTLYHLGDWSFGGRLNIYKFRQRLRCRNIHLIYGNHDKHIESNVAIETTFEDEGNTYSGPMVTPQSLFSSVQPLLRVKLEGQEFTLCHYALRIWENAHKGAINLYGHSHGRLPDSGLNQMDVGMDAVNFHPISLEEVVRLMKARPVNNTDSRNK